MPIDPKTNVLDRAYEEMTRILRRDGQPAPDEASFVHGFMCCFGIMVGRVDIGLDPDEPLDKILDVIHRNIADYGRRAAERVGAMNGMNGHGG